MIIINIVLYLNSKLHRVLFFAHVILYSALFSKRYVEFVGKSHFKMRPSTHVIMKNSRIIIENGDLSIGTSFGNIGGLGIDPSRDNCRIHLNNSVLRISGNVSLFPGCVVWAQDGEIVIRNGTVVNPQAYIISRGRIEIGEHCLIALGVIIRDHDGHKLAFGDGKPMGIIKEIVIKDHCWIGHNVIILKGVTIGEGAVVAAGSIVTEDVRPRTLVGGVPAKVIRENVVWEE